MKIQNKNCYKFNNKLNQLLTNNCLKCYYFNSKQFKKICFILFFIKRLIYNRM